MANQYWSDAFKEVKTRLVHIKCPNGNGTGFIVHINSKKKFVVIATAFHVIKDVYEWGYPMKIKFEKNDETCLLKEKDRFFFPEAKKDFALMVFYYNDADKLDGPLSLAPKEKHLRSGVEIAWTGFPAIYPKQACFFSGKVSTFIFEDKAYLVDGVTINGVSGGPAFLEKPQIVGVVTAYLPNRYSGTGETLPGVGMIISIEPYIEKIENLGMELDKEQRGTVDKGQHNSE